tara:strand:+ start:135 stop:1199 length:1065 start_codon:yes stop_codon:yes gene_type:complete
MPAESLSQGLLSVFSLISFFTFLLIKNFSNKIGKGLLLDLDFDKPQAFHKEAVSRVGGLASIISLVIFFILYYFLFNQILFAYLFLSVSLFLLGFIEDLQSKISPNYRLISMFFILIFFINFFSINIGAIDLAFLSEWMNNKLFANLFLLLCFLFIINGSNLIDGFNGLLTIHLLIINLILFFINLNTSNQDLLLFITAQIVVLTCFLLFNFPRAKMFLGDSGSYLFGSLVALNVINTHNSNTETSSFFFCILLFYLFFEVFFSFFRKIYIKQSPLKPDRKHLHMLLYNFLSRSQKFKDCNYLTSIIINAIYFCLILPVVFFYDNGFICKYWFFSLLVIYMVFYFLLYSFEKKQ